MDAFSDLIGQPQAIELLSRVIAQNRIAPAYLFVGIPGVGRSLAAQYFIELLLQKGRKNLLNSSEEDAHKQSIKHRVKMRNHPDLLWVEPTYLHQGKLLSAAEAAASGLKRRAPPQIRLDQVREISQFVSRPALESLRSVVVLEAAETMAEGAANGLLKTLEEPGKSVLILIAPSVDSLLSTLVSRCAKIPFVRLSNTDIIQILTQKGYGEICRHAEIMAMAQGSPGQAIACWEQLQTIPPELLTKVKKLPQSLRESLELAAEISRSLDTQAQLWLVDYLQHSYWEQYHNPGVNGNNSLPAIPGLLHQLEQARKHLLAYVQPRLVWECTLMAIANI
ncbi:DNA polymerase III subunit delta' [Limnospira sp. PMC 1298.21]|uniref:DNA polymerase III subunit delta' n=1 Tax=Limnospira sp. PMC 1298.21 TaxID=2981081 RepID=UPI0028E16902|nr:DNA polymerase III subunit delta' [Limnospira sp. PMC 1298.21]MDT9283709.1 DNA polymerase III subunit delta' [Limnospira sp. PMC 1298.21]